MPTTIHHSIRKQKSAQKLGGGNKLPKKQEATNCPKIRRQQIAQKLEGNKLPRCSVSGFRQGVHTVSWTKTTSQSADPIALTFNDKVNMGNLQKYQENKNVQCEQYKVNMGKMQND